MSKLQFQFVNLPHEFVTLLKSNLALSNDPAPIIDLISPNLALLSVLETAFNEFNGDRGIEKVFKTLGWSNFRDRMASIYIYKLKYGDFPFQTDTELVEDIKQLENRFSDHSVHSYSRLFLLGFYFKFANLDIQHREDNHFLELTIPSEIESLLKLSQGRSERIDWLILILYHLYHSLGEKLVMNSLISGKKFEDIYALMPKDAQEVMAQNLLAYGASIQEPDLFLYEKV